MISDAVSRALRRTSIALLGVGLLAVPAMAGDDEGLANRNITYTSPVVPGSGTVAPTCSDYLGALKGHKIGYHKEAVQDGEKYFDESFLLAEYIGGYIAGMNYLGMQLRHKQADVQYGEIELWLRDYCNANPSVSLVRAVNVFYDEHAK